MFLLTRKMISPEQPATNLFGFLEEMATGQVSYLINDVYARFIRPGADAKEAVRASRAGADRRLDSKGPQPAVSQNHRSDEN